MNTRNAQLLRNNLVLHETPYTYGNSAYFSKNVVYLCEDAPFLRYSIQKSSKNRCEIVHS